MWWITNYFFLSHLKPTLVTVTLDEFILLMDVWNVLWSAVEIGIHELLCGHTFLLFNVVNWERIAKVDSLSLVWCLQIKTFVELKSLKTIQFSYFARASIEQCIGLNLFAWGSVLAILFAVGFIKCCISQLLLGELLRQNMWLKFRFYKESDCEVYLPNCMPHRNLNGMINQ